MKKDGIAIIGRMAQNKQLLDGQTVKTNVLLAELCQCYPNREFVCVDTYQYIRNIVPILVNTIRAFVKCKHIFVAVSRNGRRFFFPLLTGINFFFHRRLYHDVIGGALPGEARQSRGLRKQLRRFDVNWVEFEQMKVDLEELGVHNVEVLPNFKRLNVLSPDQLKCNHQSPFVFSMFSRVMKEKGITASVEAVAEVNNTLGSKAAVLHIYGPVEDAYREEFEQLLERHSDCVSYMGCVPQDKSVDALRESFMLLFPSVYVGEGMPGTIIDAFSAGLPVIATNWHFNGELVRNGETGYCYDWTKPELLKQSILYAVTHPEEVDTMRETCLAEASQYSPEFAMERICRKMGE